MLVPSQIILLTLIDTQNHVFLTWTELPTGLTAINVTEPDRFNITDKCILIMHVVVNVSCF